MSDDPEAEIDLDDPDLEWVDDADDTAELEELPAAEDTDLRDE